MQQPQATCASRENPSERCSLQQGHLGQASYIVLIEGLLMRRLSEAAGRTGLRKRRSVRVARKVPQSTGAAVSGSTDESSTAPFLDRLALRQLRSCQLCVILKHRVAPRQRIAESTQTLSRQRRNSRRRANGIQLKCTVATVTAIMRRNVRMRPHQSTAAMMRTRRMIKAMTGKELPAAAPRQPSKSAEALSRADEAGSLILPCKCRYL